MSSQNNGRDVANNVSLRKSFAPFQTTLTD